MLGVRDDEDGGADGDDEREGRGGGGGVVVTEKMILNALRHDVEDGRRRRRPSPRPRERRKVSLLLDPTDLANSIYAASLPQRPKENWRYDRWAPLLSWDVGFWYEERKGMYDFNGGFCHRRVWRVRWRRVGWFFIWVLVGWGGGEVVRGVLGGVGGWCCGGRARGRRGRGEGEVD